MFALGKSVVDLNYKRLVSSMEISFMAQSRAIDAGEVLTISPQKGCKLASLVVRCAIAVVSFTMGETVRKYSKISEDVANCRKLSKHSINRGDYPRALLAVNQMV